MVKYEVVHRDFAELLPAAHGDSELAIVANVDIRGFSEFSERVESVQAAYFIRRVYTRLIEQFFEDADFYKPTGDGLLVVIHVDEHNVQDRMEATVRTCLASLDAFPTIASDDPLVNFAVPQSLGIGLSRGAACRLATPEKTLDYSGRTLNLATRLMDFARPDGIVIDAEFGIELLPDELRGLFEAHDVYIRSVAQRTTRRIHALAGRTVISDAAKRPIDEPVWHEQSRTWPTVRAFRDSGASFRIALDHRVSDPNELVVTLLHPAVGPGGNRHPDDLATYRRLGLDKAVYSEEAGNGLLSIRPADLTAEILADRVRLGWGKVYLRISYPLN